jgi:hypothetical protein
MDQIRLFELPYKYIIDASSLLSQKEGEPHNRKTYVTMWENIERYIKEQKIITCSEIAEEVQDKEISDWLSLLPCTVLEIDDDVQSNVVTVVTSNPRLIEFQQNKSSGDAFLIATAMKHRLIVVTEERKSSPKKIPQVCQNLGIDCININELCERENWRF